MAVDANYLYFVGYRDTSGGIYRIGRGGGSSSIVAGGNFNSAPLAVDAKSIYAIANNDGADPAGDLWMLPKLCASRTRRTPRCRL